MIVKDIKMRELIVNPIKTNKGQVFIKIVLNDKKLSITGVVAPKINGNCNGGCGQILDCLTSTDIFINAGWNSEMIDKLYDVWEKWHLNDMKSGTPKQEEAIDIWNQQNYNYIKTCDYLKSIDLYCDGQVIYGHQWLTEEVPKNIIDWLFDLPISVIKPAWC